MALYLIEMNDSYLINYEMEQFGSKWIWLDNNYSSIYKIKNLKNDFTVTILVITKRIITTTSIANTPTLTNELTTPIQSTIKTSTDGFAMKSTDNLTTTSIDRASAKPTVNIVNTPIEVFRNINLTRYIR